MSAVRMKASDLPPKVREQLGAKEPKRKDKTAPLPRSKVDLACHACGERFTAEAAIYRHRDATGHLRYEVPLS
jgi:hypothetical protein